MTKKKKNPVWAFFASVKLALFLLFVLAGTSIIGTVVPQNEPAQFYVQQYGASTAAFMQRLGVPDMYNSWWFLGLLALFCLNLIVCSLERIPQAWRLVTRDNLTTPVDRLRKMGIRKEVLLKHPLAEAEKEVASHLASHGWKTGRRAVDGGTLLFAQKGAWTRFGVYIVHTSILVILLGAIIGSPTVARKILRNPNFAFKGSVMIPESREADYVWAFQTHEKIDLGFTIRCDYFTIEYYANGMPKTYLSKVTILEDGKPVILKDGKTTHYLKVNKPLTYKGVTFYQASYQPYPDFIVTLKNETTGATRTSIIPAGKQINWPDIGASFGIINRETLGEVVRRVKIWFTDNKDKPSRFWIETGREAIIERPSGNFSLMTKQLYATGLQVTKDPGVWFVYVGCGMMLLGLLVAFFMSHRKVWAFLHEEKEGETVVLLAGSANKNKLGFEKRFASLVGSLQR